MSVSGRPTQALLAVHSRPQLLGTRARCLRRMCDRCVLGGVNPAASERHAHWVHVDLDWTSHAVLDSLRLVCARASPCGAQLSTLTDLELITAAVEFKTLCVCQRKRTDVL